MNVWIFAGTKQSGRCRQRGSLPCSRFYIRHATLFSTLRDETKNGFEGDQQRGGCYRKLALSGGLTALQFYFI